MNRDDLVELHKRTGLDQNQLAPLMGMVQSEFSRLATGERGLTKKHRALIRCLRVISDHDLIDALRREMDNG